MGFDEHNKKDAIIAQYQDDLARSQEDGLAIRGLDMDCDTFDCIIEVFEQRNA